MFFKPYIERTNAGFWVTAPYEIRDKIWDILFKIQKRVIDISEGEATEICVVANPGHKDEDALAILIAATHIALAGFGGLYPIGKITEHYKAIRSSIDFRDNLSSLNAELNIAPYLETWIKNEATSNIRMMINEIHGVRLPSLAAHMEELENAKQRIEFSNMNFFKKAARIKECNNAIEALKVCQAQIAFLNKNIELIQETARIHENNFKRLLEVDVLSSFDSYMDLFAMLKGNFQTADEFRNSIDLEESENLVREIILLAPPITK